MNKLRLLAVTAEAPEVIAGSGTELRAVVRSLLERGGISVAGEVADGASALDQAERLGVDVVILDAAMPATGPATVIDGLRRLQPAPAVVIYSGWPAAELAELDVPVVPKGADPKQLVAAVRRAARLRADG